MNREDALTPYPRLATQRITSNTKNMAEHTSTFPHIHYRYLLRTYSRRPTNLIDYFDTLCHASKDPEIALIGFALAELLRPLDANIGHFFKLTSTFEKIGDSSKSCRMRYEVNTHPL